MGRVACGTVVLVNMCNIYIYTHILYIYIRVNIHIHLYVYIYIYMQYFGPDVADPSCKQ